MVNQQFSRIRTRGREYVVRHWLDELKDTKASHKRISKRLRLLRTFILWHYVLLALSAFNLLLALFAILNTNAPWRPAMLALCAASFALAAYLLFAGIGK